MKKLNSPDGRIAARSVTLLLIILLIALGGDSLNERFGKMSKKIDIPQRAEQEKNKREIAARFKQGVAMLNAKQYDYAATAFQRVLKLAPKMPEAHVNMGYALLGLQYFSDAAEFFKGAIMLNAYMANAYYGMALAQEGLGNLPAAEQAMNTYLRHARPDDPYREKAVLMLARWKKGKAS